jgi:hypothetical protein
VANGSYPFTITGTTGAITHSIPATLVIGSVTPSFTLSPSPASITLLPNATTQNSSTIAVQSHNGFNSPVALAISGCPANAGCAVTSPVTPPANGSVPATLTVTPSQTTPAGNYTVSVSGNSGAATATVGVTIQDFALSPAPAAVTVNRGTAGSSAVSVQSQNGFNQTVTVTLSNCPTGTTCLFSNGQPSMTFTPPAGGSITGAVNIVTSATTPLGPTTLGVSAQVGADVHTTILALTVVQAPDFQLSVNPTSINFAKTQGQSSATITITSANGFSGNVTLTYSGCPVACTIQSPEAVPGGGSAGSTLTLMASAKSPAMSGTVTVTVTSGGLSHQLQIPYNITSPASVGTIANVGVTAANMEAIALNSGGTLYGGTSGTGALYTINPATGAATLIHALVGVSNASLTYGVNGLAFQPGTGTSTGPPARTLPTPGIVWSL